MRKESSGKESLLYEKMKDRKSSTFRNYVVIAVTIISSMYGYNEFIKEKAKEDVFLFNILTKTVPALEERLKKLELIAILNEEALNSASLTHASRKSMLTEISALKVLIKEMNNFNDSQFDDLEFRLNKHRANNQTHQIK